ncbi:MAG: hypothetical protein SCJ97_07315 [Bacillota bacterium]|nr:hypothetical protein [Bacillota bacterium]
MRYFSGLLAVLPPTGGLIFFGIFTIIIGLTSIIYPRLFWYLRIGRKIGQVPPQNLYLLVLRFGGLLVVILGIVMISYARQFGMQ